MKNKRHDAKGRKRRRAKEDVALDTAIRLHQSGAIVEAERAYQRVLDLHPRHPQALYLAGVVTGQLGRPNEAIALLQSAISLEPDYLQAISELAKLFQETGQFQASADALRKLIALRPDLAALYSNLAIVLQHLDRPEEAAVACEKAIELNSDSHEAHGTLGDILKSLGRLDEAAAAYRRAIVLRPESADIYRNLVAILRNAGELKEATDVLRQWLNYEPDNPIAQHMMSAYGGDNTPPRASDDYVRQVFNEFATTFNDDLHDLSYQGPRLIYDALTAELPEGAEGLDVLDAGCGTGLCGSLLRHLARHLTGVDLSAAMLQQARELKLYDNLVESELIAYLKRHTERFDVIVAADTFNYFGALPPLLTATTNALCATGVLVFTLEDCQASASVADYRLNPNGRYSHNHEYVKRCIDNCGLTMLAMDSATLRHERDHPVAGFVVRARRPPQSPPH